MRELTLTRHVNHHIDVDVQGVSLVGVHAELMVWPSPDVLANIVQNQEESNDGNEDSEETARFGSRLVGRRYFGKGIELRERCRDDFVELVQNGRGLWSVDGLGHRGHRQNGRRRCRPGGGGAAASTTPREEMERV